MVVVPQGPGTKGDPNRILNGDPVQSRNIAVPYSRTIIPER